MSQQKGAEDTDLRDPNLESIPPVVAGMGLRGSFRAALSGVLRTIATQRNMKIHLVSAQAVMIVGMALPLDVATRVALLFAVGLVFFAEILNTALEALVDLFVRDFHRLALMAKDAAAGGVLVLSSVTVLVLAEILAVHWEMVASHERAVLWSVAWGVPFIIMEALGLFLVRRGWLAIVRGVVAGGLLGPLALRSEDPIFAICAAILFVVAAYARWAFPRFPGRGAPRRGGVA